MRAACFAVIALAFFAVANGLDELDLEYNSESGSCGEKLTWHYYNTTKILTINGTGKMTDYTKATAPWYRFRTGITSVEIDSGVESIGSYAFYYMTSMTSIVIPNSVTLIGHDAFYYCIDLAGVNLPKYIKSIPNFCFYSCLSLKRIDIPNQVTYIGQYAFYLCKNMVSVYIPTSVKTIDIAAFSYCKALGSIYLHPLLKYLKTSAFEYCESLESVTVPAAVETVEPFCFSHCSKLNSVVLMEGVSKLNADAFSYCHELETVKIPDSLTRIERYAFYRCSALKSVHIPAQLEYIGDNAFYRCTNLTYITVNASNGHYASHDGVLFSRYYETLIRYPAGKDYTSYEIPSTVKTIGRFAFASCTHLTEVTIPSRVTLIPRHAFYYSRKLSKVTFNGDVTAIGQSAFAHCDELSTITLPSTVEQIGDFAFYHCLKLTSFTIPVSLTSIGTAAFYRCTGITSFSVAKGNLRFLVDTSGVLFSRLSPKLRLSTLIQYPLGRTASSYAVSSTVAGIASYAFASCSHLTSVTLPSALISIGNHAFYSCSNLRSVNIPSTITTINKYTFAWCVNLQSLSLPAGLKSIEEGAFADCKAMTSLIIPDGVTSLGRLSLSNCHALTELIIPESVTYIGSEAFIWDKNLQRVFYEGNTPITTSNAFSDCYSLSRVCVPPDYDSTKSFCGRMPTPTLEPCASFRTGFDHCYKYSYKNGAFVRTQRQNATEYEKRTDGCEEFHCINSTGPVHWSLCNSTDEITRMCTSDRICTVTENRTKSGWDVEIEVDSLDPDDVNSTDIVTMISNMTGVNSSDLSVSYEVDNHGNVVRIIIHVSSQEGADAVYDAIDNMPKGSGCNYSPLCFATRVHVIDWENLSGAFSIHNSILAHIMMMLVVILFIII